MSRIGKNSVITIDWAKFVGVEVFSTVAVSVGKHVLSIFGTVSIDLKAISSYVMKVSWFLLIGVAIFEVATSIVTDWPSLVEFSFECL